MFRGIILMNTKRNLWNVDSLQIWRKLFTLIQILILKFLCGFLRRNIAIEEQKQFEILINIKTFFSCGRLRCGCPLVIGHKQVLSIIWNFRETSRNKKLFHFEELQPWRLTISSSIKVMFGVLETPSLEKRVYFRKEKLLSKFLHQ